MGESTAKRLPEQKLIWMGQLETWYDPEIFLEASPNEAFDYAWVSDLLDSVIAQVRQYYHKTGKISHWHVFYEKVVQPIIQGSKPPALAEICKKHGIENTTKASSLILTVKRMFRTILRHELRKIAWSDKQVNTELEELRKFFLKKQC